MEKKIIDLNLFFSVEQMVAICLDHREYMASINGTEYSEIENQLNKKVLVFLTAYCINKLETTSEDDVFNMLDKLQNDRYTEILLSTGKIKPIFMGDGTIEYTTTGRRR